jgi:hypothetical protein
MLRLSACAIGHFVAGDTFFADVRSNRTVGKFTALRSMNEPQPRLPPTPCGDYRFSLRQYCQPACKPGSVWPRRLAAPERGGHSSWARIAARLVQPTRAAGRKLPRGLPLMPPLFGLAPGVVYQAAPVAGNAVGSYPTLSPLPARGGRSAFCGTVTGVAPAGRYPAPCFQGARTFLTCSLSTLACAAARPAGVAH